MRLVTVMSLPMTGAESDVVLLEWVWLFLPGWYAGTGDVKFPNGFLEETKHKPSLLALTAVKCHTCQSSIVIVITTWFFVGLVDWPFSVSEAVTKVTRSTASLLV